MTFWEEYDTILIGKNQGNSLWSSPTNKGNEKKEGEVVKNFISTLALTMALVAISLSMPALGAENEPLERGMFFSSLEACKQAWEADFRYYKPDPNNIRTPLSEAKGLPKAGCALEDVREHKGESPAWVILASDTPAVFGADGTPILDGRCWNKIHEFVWLPRLRGLPGARGLTGPMGPAGPRGLQGPPGKDFTPEDRFNGWCGIWTDLGCTVLAGAVVGGTIYIATQGNNDKPGPIVHSDPPSARVGLAPSVKIGYVPSPHGGGKGGISVIAGGRLSF